MQYRPFRLWPDATLQTVGQRLRGVIELWQREWGLGQLLRLDGAASMSPYRKADDVGDRWQFHLALERGRLWCGWDEAMARMLSRILYPTLGGVEHACDSLSGMSGAACLAAFASTLGRQFHACTVAPSSNLPPVEVWQPGSGALMLSARLDEGTLWLLLDEAAVAHLAPLRPVPFLAPLPAVAPDASLAHLVASVSVKAGGAHLCLAELATLAVGDVIPLERRIDAPLDVMTTGDARVCGARLLREGEHVVLEMCV
jgi:hypothetical protein